uniref:EexN family lipoprotein n=1 Tax=Escherichia coli TaxID=562 RepID=UPI00155DA6D7|nr:EexN family lipoprotein [Escherichia coli]
MKKFISTLTILSCFLLAACEDKVYDVSYYTEHLEQAQDVVEKMQQRDMSGQNCENAREAIQKEQSGKAFKNMMQ